MVTDEERDYMYRVYAHDSQARINLGIRRRLAPLLNNHRRRIELMNGLLLSLPGTPVLYYGDEIGMGDNIYLGDRNGVRTPMQWSADRNAGFSRANPQRLYLPIVIDPEYHPEALNVEAQQGNPHSVLWWTKRLIALRKRLRAFGRGSIEFLHPENRRILAFLRSYQSERILVVANLSRFVQYVELDLSAHQGMAPVELFGNTEFPPIGERPYFLTLGPHSFYWFVLRPVQEEARPATGPAPDALPEFAFSGEWSNEDIRAIEFMLPSYLQRSRWFAGKAKQLKEASIIEAVRLASAAAYRVAIVRVSYVDSPTEIYAVPLACAFDAPAGAAPPPIDTALARVHTGERTGTLFDATADPGFATLLLDLIARRRRLPTAGGRLVATPTRAFKALRGDGEGCEPTVLKGEQSNTSIVYGDRMILKLFRRLEEGVNPDLEVGRFLTERVAFPHTPDVAGVLSFERPNGLPSTLGILRAFVPNQGDAWRYTLSTLPSYFERALVNPPAASGPPGSLVALAHAEVPADARTLIGGYLSTVILLGQRTAEFHCALAARADDPDFAPEPFTLLYQRSLYQEMRTRARQTLRLLRTRLRTLSAAARAAANEVLGLEAVLDRRLRAITAQKLCAGRIRCHGDYHLGQVLYTGKDFVIVDFEGEPARSLSERRIKRSPLRDVAGMLRSFHYAVFTALSDPSVGAVVRPEDQVRLHPAAQLWYQWVSATFLNAYLSAIGTTALLPRAEADLALMLDVYMLEKALYEVLYELSNRPQWVHVPLRGILDLLAGAGPS
jgi:maltose alpha-D-glucosyltransferase/alpha-amylase